MAKQKEEDAIEIEATKYAERYSHAYINFSKITEKHDELAFMDIIGSLFVIQENYSHRSRDTRNMFFVNSLEKAGLLEFDKGLPEDIKIFQYYTVLENQTEDEIEKNGIFVNSDQMKKFYMAFINRLFKSGIDEQAFFDKIAFNTLIKAKLLIRCDSASEDLKTLFKGFLKI